MSCIKLKPVILILALWSNIAVATTCYHSDNEFDANGDIKGMYIEFSDNSGGCSNNEAPYVIITPRGSNIKSSSEIRFTITDLNSSNLTNSGDKVNLMRIYSQNLELAEIFIYYDGSEKFISSSPPNIVHQNFELDREYIITNNHIQFASISEIQFADTPKNNKEYQFIGKIDNIKYDNSPIVISRGYIIDYDNSFDYDADNRKKSATKLKEGIKSENKLIYYDYTLDYNPTTNSGNIKNIECKSGYSPGPSNAGYYFTKDQERQIMFYGCCFKDTYDPGNYGHPSLQLTQSIDFNPELSYSSDDINQPNSQDLTQLLSSNTVGSNVIECSSSGGSIIGGSSVSYYFDIDSCEIKLYGGCQGDKVIHQSSSGAEKLDFCSTIKIGHEFQQDNVNKTEIGCEDGCVYQDNNDKLSYTISSGIVQIDGKKCIGQTKSIDDWLGSDDLPLGIDGDQNLQYADGTANISCKSGYDGSAQYSFNSGNIVFGNVSCVAKNYALSSFADSALMEGLNLQHIVSYYELGGPVILGNSACRQGYSPNDLRYYFTTAATATDPDLIIQGECGQNLCLVTDINNNNPQNTLNIESDEINSNPNCENGRCRVDAEFFLDCDDGNNYIPSQVIPRKICQNDGTWFTSGSCVCGPDFIANGPNCILNDYKSVLADRDALDFDIIRQDNQNVDDIKTALSLVSSGSNGTNIYWSSSDSNIMDNNGGIREDGVVTRPNPGLSTNNVTLHAAISKGSESTGKTFNLKVIPYSEYSRYVGLSKYQHNKTGGYRLDNGYDDDALGCAPLDSASKGSHGECAQWCKIDRSCMYSFWRYYGNWGGTCQKFSNTYQECAKVLGTEFYNDNLLYYKY